MAAEQDLKLDQANPEQSGGSKKKLIFIIVAVVLLIGLAVGVTVFLMSADEAAVEETVSEEAVTEVVEEVPIPAQYIKMKPRFIVNYNVGTRQRFLQASIEIMTRSQVVVDAVELHNPMLRNEIVRILSDQTFEALRTPEGRLALKNQLQEKLIALLKSEANAEGVEAILFTDFVMQ
jgi:flagellar FliL protein